MKKVFLLGVATGLTLAGASLVLANSQIQAILNNQIKVSLNGQLQEFRDETTNEVQYPITYKDRTYLPLRTVANLVGVGVDYDTNSNTAILSSQSVSSAETSDTRYTNYLKVYKENLMKLLSVANYNEDSKPYIAFYTTAPSGIINENNEFIRDRSKIYEIKINEKLELSLDGKKIADNVLKMYLYEGYGGGVPGFSIFFIKDDGTLNYYGYGKYNSSSEWFNQNGLHTLDLKNVVDFVEISSPIGSYIEFVDIEGNTLHW